MNENTASEIVPRPGLPDDPESLELRLRPYRYQQGSEESARTHKIEAIVCALANKDDEIRFWASAFVSRLDRYAWQVIDPLTALLTDSIPKIRLQAAVALRHVRCGNRPEVLSALIVLLDSDDNHLVVEVLNQLRLCRPATSEIVDAVTTALLNPDMSIATAAAEAIGCYGQVATAAAPVLYLIAQQAAGDTSKIDLVTSRFRISVFTALSSVLGRKDVDLYSEGYKAFNDFLRDIEGHGGPVSDVTQHGEEGKFSEVMRSAREQTHALRETLANEIAPVLNATIQAMPHETLDQKKEIARFVNDQLEPLGLAVKEPRTGRPGKLRGMVNGGLKNGAFEIEVKIEGKQVHPTISSTLPQLELMNDNPPEETIARFRELVKRSRRPTETER